MLIDPKSLWYQKIALCEGRSLEEVELQEHVECCCAFLPYIISINDLINRNNNRLIIFSLTGDRRREITAVLSTKIKQQQNKQNKFIHSKTFTPLFLKLQQIIQPQKIH